MIAESIRNHPLTSHSNVRSLPKLKTSVVVVSNKPQTIAADRIELRQQLFLQRNVKKRKINEIKGSKTNINLSWLLESFLVQSDSHYEKTVVDQE